MSELSLPKGVQLLALLHGDDDAQSHDSALVSVQHARIEVEETEEEATEEGELDEEVTKLVEAGGEEEA